MLFLDLNHTTKYVEYMTMMNALGGKHIIHLKFVWKKKNCDVFFLLVITIDLFNFTFKINICTWEYPILFKHLPPIDTMTFWPLFFPA